MKLHCFRVCWSQLHTELLWPSAAAVTTKNVPVCSPKGPRAPTVSRCWSVSPAQRRRRVRTPVCRPLSRDDAGDSGLRPVSGKLPGRK